MPARGLALIAAAALALLGLSVAQSMLAPSARADASTVTVFDSLPAANPGSLASYGMQAYQMKEFGQRLQLAGTARELSSIEVGFVDWACENWASGANLCTTTPGASFTVPITVNVYEAGPSAETVGALVATTSRDVAVPFRPSASVECGDNRWSPNGGTDCFNGYYFTSVFDFAGAPILPDDVVVSVTYNTHTQGFTPTGVLGPVDSFNVAVSGTLGATGSVADPTTSVFVNSSTAAHYTPDGVDGTGIDPSWLGTFHAGRSWSQAPIPLRINAVAPDLATLTSPTANYHRAADYKGVVVDIRTDHVTDATGIVVRVDRALGPPVIKTSKPDAPALAVVNTGLAKSVTMPIVIQPGSYDEAASTSWNQPSAVWTSATVPTSVTVTIERSGGPDLVRTLTIGTSSASAADVLPAPPGPIAVRPADIGTVVGDRTAPWARANTDNASGRYEIVADPTDGAVLELETIAGGLGVGTQTKLMHYFGSGTYPSIDALATVVGGDPVATIPLGMVVTAPFSATFRSPTYLSLQVEVYYGADKYFTLYQVRKNATSWTSFATDPDALWTISRALTDASGAPLNVCRATGDKECKNGEVVTIGNLLAGLADQDPRAISVGVDKGRDSSSANAGLAQVRDISFAGQTFVFALPLAWTSTPTPTVSGTARPGNTLTVSAGSWAPAPDSLTFEWFRGGVSVGTGASYALAGADVGGSITVRATATKTGYPTVVKTSAPTIVEANAWTTTPVPTISGTPLEGQTLTASAGTWGPVPDSIAFQWFRGAVAVGAGTAYTLGAEDVGAVVTVRVTATKAGYPTEVRGSGEVLVAGREAPPPPPPSLPTDPDTPPPPPSSEGANGQPIPPPSLPAPPTPPAPGGSVPISFAPGTFLAYEWVQFTFYSTPTFSTSVQATATGALSASIPVPSSLPAGQHTIAAVGASSGVTVTAPVVVAASPRLPNTGQDAAQLWLLAMIGGAVALGGAALVVIGRAHRGSQRAS